MKDLRQYITKNIEYGPISFLNNDHLNFFAYCIYNSFQVQPDVSDDLHRMISEEMGYFVYSWDEFDQVHVSDFLPEYHWIRKIVLECMIEGNYEIEQVSQYVETEEDSNKAIEEVLEMMGRYNLTKKERLQVKKYYEREFFEGHRIFAIVVKADGLEKIYHHKELRRLFQSATNLGFQKKNIVFQAFVIDEQGYEPNMISSLEVEEFINLYNEKYKRAKRLHQENMAVANKINNMSNWETETNYIINQVLTTFETESQVIF